MRAHDHKSAGLLPGALLAVLVALVGLAGAVKIARSAMSLGPTVGDILQFDPQGFLPLDLRTRVAAERTDASGCMLDVEAIHRAGGSLVVEQRYPGNGNLRYRVHLAGRGNVGSSSECGREADLTLDDTNLELLAMAAGGWGVAHKHVSPSQLWSDAGVRSNRGQ
jgi:hypothetical protein